MKVFIAVDENQVVRCMASERCNIHRDKQYMDIYYVDRKGTVGDEYDTATDTWTARPENYPQPSEAQIAEKKITTEMQAIQRAQAIQSLKDRGELPADFAGK